jgi:cupin 2 domain-containing protein
MRGGNLKRGIPHLLPDELFSTLCAGGGTRVERIVSRGHTSAADFWYDQDDTELVLVVQGHARIEVEGEGEFDLSPFDWLVLPPHTRHRVSHTAPGVDTVWLAVFFPAPLPELRVLAPEADHTEGGQRDEGEGQ